jgi:hypothetical protein
LGTVSISILSALVILLAFPNFKVASTAEQVRYERQLTALNDDLERSKEDLVGVLELGVSYPAYDFLYSTYIFKLPFTDGVSDILINRKLDTSKNYKFLISSNSAILEEHVTCLKKEYRDYYIYDAKCIGLTGK